MNTTTPEWVALFISSPILDCAASILRHLDLSVVFLKSPTIATVVSDPAICKPLRCQPQFSDSRWHDVHYCWPLALHVESLGQALEWQYARIKDFLWPFAVRLYATGGGPCFGCTTLQLLSTPPGIFTKDFPMTCMGGSFGQAPIKAVKWHMAFTAY